jgi:DNA-binding transcriptional LysR family regulator
LGDVRIDDLRALLVVERTASLAAAARQLRSSPSRVSKIVARLEKRLGQALLTRTSRGVGLTEGGQRLLPGIAGLVAQFDTLLAREKAPTLDLTFAAEPYLVAMCQPAIAASVPRLRVCGLSLSAPAVRARVAEGAFDLALVTSHMRDLPPSWVLRRVGRLRKGLFTTPKTAERLRRVGSTVTVDGLRDEPMVSPTIDATDLSALLDDDCPLSRMERVVGHQTETMMVGLAVAAATGQLVFGPVALARPYLQAGQLTEVPVVGWNVCPELQLLCHVDRVSSKVLEAVLRTLRKTLDEAHVEA